MNGQRFLTSIAKLFAICIGLFFSTNLPAAFQASPPPPLRIAIAQFIPPFIMQGANHSWDGFDIVIMNHVCKQLNRVCEYYSMPFNQLLTAVENKTVDLSISAITITPERSLRVSFSIPYMLSYGRFLGQTPVKTTAANNVPFNTRQLAHQKVGVLQGSVFVPTLLKMGLSNDQIIQYSESENIINAINTGEVFMALIDNPTATYWQIHSSGSLQIFGDLITPAQGFGLGIAIRQGDPLLASINVALLDFENSEEFKQIFSIYFSNQ